MQVVSQLELHLQKERDRLQAMMHHLYLTRRGGGGPTDGHASEKNAQAQAQIQLDEAEHNVQLSAEMTTPTTTITTSTGPAANAALPPTPDASASASANATALDNHPNASHSGAAADSMAAHSSQEPQQQPQQSGDHLHNSHHLHPAFGGISAVADCVKHECDNATGGGGGDQMRRRRRDRSVDLSAAASGGQQQHHNDDQSLDNRAADADAVGMGTPASSGRAGGGGEETNPRAASTKVSEGRVYIYFLAFPISLVVILVLGLCFCWFFGERFENESNF